MANDYSSFGVTVEFAEAHDTAVWKEIPGIQDVGVPPVTATKRDATAHDTGGRVLRLAYEEFGARPCTIMYDPDDTVHQDILRLCQSQDEVDVRILLTNTGISPTPEITFTADFEGIDLPLPAAEAETMLLTFQIQATSRPAFPIGSSSTST